MWVTEFAKNIAHKETATLSMPLAKSVTHVLNPGACVGGWVMSVAEIFELDFTCAILVQCVSNIVRHPW